MRIHLNLYKYMYLHTDFNISHLLYEYLCAFHRNYIVEKFDSKKGEWERVNDSVAGTNCTVPRLQEGHQYKFRVMAENSNGVSEALEADEPVVAKNPYDPPSSPGRLEIVDHDRTHIDLKWQPPESDGGAPITGYVLERREVKGTRWTRVTRELLTVCTCVDDGVREGKEYEYRVSAVNKAGQSEPSRTAGPVFAKPSKGEARHPLRPSPTLSDSPAPEQTEVHLHYKCEYNNAHAHVLYICRSGQTVARLARRQRHPRARRRAARHPNPGERNADAKDRVEARRQASGTVQGLYLYLYLYSTPS